MVVQLPQQGGCRCGKARYVIIGAPLLAYVCHCHDCQKASGSAFSLTLVVRTADLEMEGSFEMKNRTSRAGRIVQERFCPECHANLLARAIDAPDYTSVRVGTLDTGDWVVPISQSFVESAFPWAIIPGVKIVPWDRFDYYALGAEWVETAPIFKHTS